MATMNPVLRLRRAFRSVAGPEPVSEQQAEEAAEEAADAITSYSYSQRESDLRHAQMLADFGRQMAETRNQILLAIFLAAGLIIAALGLIIALVD